MSWFTPTISFQSILASYSLKDTTTTPPETNNSNPPTKSPRERVFDPTFYTHHETGISILYNSILGIQSLAPSDLSTVEDEAFYTPVVVDIHGAVRDLDTPNARAAYGVYFGPESNNNFTSSLPQDAWMHNQGAAIYSAIMAVKKISEILDKNTSGSNTTSEEGGYAATQKLATLRDNLKLGVLKTDAIALKSDLAKNIFIWMMRRFKNTAGKPIVSGPLLQVLHELVVGLEERGIEVQIWHVSRKENKKAEWLAKQTFKKT